MNAANNDWFRKFCDIVYEKRNLLLTIAIILFVLTSALSQVFPTMHFRPTNGAFQNYNIVRRLLDGQTPYKDFVVYLGGLHLYLGAILTWITGNCFASSVFSYNILAPVSFIVLSIVLGKALKFSYTRICTLIIIIFCAANLCFHNDSSSVLGFTKLSPYILYTENSARLLRALPLFLSCLFIYLIEKKVTDEKLQDLSWGCVAGFAFPCSNDFGVSTVLALSIIFLLLKIVQKKSVKNILVGGLIYLAGFLLSLITFVLVFSQGHIFDWFSVTFGQGSDQGWYFISSFEKATKIFQVNIMPVVLIQIFFTLFFVYKLICAIKNNANNDEKIKYLLLLLLNFTGCIVAQELNFFSDRNSLIPDIIICTTLVFYFSQHINNLIYKLFDNSISEKCYNKIGATVVGLLVIVNILFNAGSCFLKSQEVKIDKLGGRLSQFGNDVLEAKNFIKDEKIFSTYASALEVVTNQFQPSGYDYIIHVLGDKSREKYMNTFRKGDFKYVTTQRYRTTIDNWEAWIVYGNWYFYRELYRHYKPVYSTSYLTFYEPAKKEDYNTLPKNSVIKFEEITKNKYKISVTTEHSINAIADLRIDFDIKKKTFSKLFTYRTMLKIVYPNLVDNYELVLNRIYRPDKSHTIGIPIINGYGELIVNSEPLHNVKLNINNVIVGKYYKTPMKYININEVIDNKKLVIDNFTFNKLLLCNKHLVKINNKLYTIKRSNYLDQYCVYKESSYIILELDKPVDSNARILEIIE